jgi:TonB family protein
MRALIPRLMILLGALCGAQCQTLPQPVHLVSPRYPELARQAQIQGTVNVRLHLDSVGTVVAMEITGGHSLLEEEVKRNLRKWKFVPGTKDDLEMSYEFRLEPPQVSYTPEADVSFDLPSKVVIVSHPMVPIRDNVDIHKKK